MTECIQTPQTNDGIDISCSDDDVRQAEERYWAPGPESVAQKLKLRMLHCAAMSGGVAGRILGARHSDSVAVLTWHRIAHHDRRVPFPSINVTPDNFRRQITGLLQQGCEFISLPQALQSFSNGDCDSRRNRTVVVTFDDIYDNVFLHAWPVLREFGIPFTVFLSTAYLDSRQPFPFDQWALRNGHIVAAEAWIPVTTAHLEQMLSSGLMTIGAHTHTHQDFRGRPDAFADDVGAGIQHLQTRFGRSAYPFAFPYGSPRDGFCAQPLMQAVKNHGLTCGLTTGPKTNRPSDHEFGWGRFHVFQHDTVLSLLGKIDGWYEWLPHIRNLMTSARTALAGQEKQ